MIRKALIALLLVFPGVAHADWYEADSRHFAVLSKDDPKHLQKYAEQLERFDEAMRVLRGIDDPPVAPINRVTVFVVRDATEIESLAGYGVRGFYKADIGGPVAFVPRQAPSKNSFSGSRLFTSTSGGQFDLDGDSVLRHEYAHHFMFDNYPGMALPFWFVEGFAEFHATAIFNDDGSVTFGAPPTYRAASLIDRDRLSVRDMLTSDGRRMDLDEVSEVYGRGWLLIHYMTFAPSRRGQLGSFLRLLNQGKTPVEAAKVFGDLDVLQPGPRLDLDDRGDGGVPGGRVVVAGVQRGPGGPEAARDQCARDEADDVRDVSRAGHHEHRAHHRAAVERMRHLVRSASPRR